MEQPNFERTFQKRAKDPLLYHGLASRICGGIQITAGLLSMALGVGAICTYASGYFIGYGIWAGFMFCLSGIFGIWSSYRRTSCMITATMVLCVLSFCCAAAQFALAIRAAVNDKERSETGELSRDRQYLGYDIYYERNNPFRYLYRYHCTDAYGAFTWESSWGPVDILLVIVGFIEIVFAIISASICCAAVCCGIRWINIAARGAYTSGYTEGYAESRISEAPSVFRIVS